MGLKNWLFGNSSKAPEPQSGRPAAESDIFGRILEIPSRKFFGIFAKSPNQRFTLAWCDGGPDQARTGRYILLDREQIVVEGKMPRPNDGRVADSGIFILNDWGSSESLNGVFVASAQMALKSSPANSKPIC